MARAAQQHMEQRKVEVNRKQLIETLESNKKKHVAEYQEAKAGYRAVLLKKIDESFSHATKSLDRKRDELIRWAKDLSDEELAKTHDTVVLLNHIMLEMKVPRCYAAEYDAAIDIAKWDVRETLELSYAEFTCFVRDQWDWKSEFRETYLGYTQQA